MKYSLNEEQINGFLNEVANPALRSLFRMMLNNQQQQEDNPVPRGITLNKAVADVKDLLKMNQLMKSALTELKSDNEKMAERYRTLTKALGACECLGENVICPICHGKGIPGSLMIDEKAFNKYVYPLIQKITQTVEQSQADEGEKQNTNSKQNGPEQYNKNGISK